MADGLCMSRQRSEDGVILPWVRRNDEFWYLCIPNLYSFVPATAPYVLSNQPQGVHIFFVPFEPRGVSIAVRRLNTSLSKNLLPCCRHWSLHRYYNPKLYSLRVEGNSCVRQQRCQSHLVSRVALAHHCEIGDVRLYWIVKCLHRSRSRQYLHRKTYIGLA